MVSVLSTLKFLGSWGAESAYSWIVLRWVETRTLEGTTFLFSRPDELDACSFVLL
jgi:hypothetical protein